MKNIISVILAIALIFPAYSAEPTSKMNVDKIMFQIASKKWVSTKTALLKIQINATLSNTDLVQARNDMMKQLNKIAQTDWHLTKFDRSQDSSGLEKLWVTAEARVPQQALNKVYQNAKSVSKPGVKYSVSSIEFKPSLQEIQSVRAKLRESLYQQVNAELQRINKNYSQQNYSLYRLFFVEGNQTEARPKAFKERKLNNMMMAAASAPDITVSNELIMTAIVIAASNRIKE